jgi:hypothetical protein
MVGDSNGSLDLWQMAEGIESVRARESGPEEGEKDYRGKLAGWKSRKRVLFGIGY